MFVPVPPLFLRTHLFVCWMIRLLSLPSMASHPPHIPEPFPLLPFLPLPSPPPLNTYLFVCWLIMLLSTPNDSRMLVAVSADSLRRSESDPVRDPVSGTLSIFSRVARL